VPAAQSFIDVNGRGDGALPESFLARNVEGVQPNGTEPMAADSKPTVAFATRVDTKTHALRQRLQQQLGVTTPVLVVKALQALERSLLKGKSDSEVRPAA
jgi:hypothetical protein